LRGIKRRESELNGAQKSESEFKGYSNILNTDSEPCFNIFQQRESRRDNSLESE